MTNPTQILTAEQSAELAPTAITPVDKVRLVKFKESWGEALARYTKKLEGQVLETQDQMQWLSDAMTRVAVELKDLEDERVLITKPMVDEKRKIDEDFRDHRAPAEQLLDILKKATQRCFKAIKEKEAALLLAAETAAVLGDDEACQTALATLPETKVSGASGKLVWKWTVKTPAEVPVEHMMPNEKSLDALCKMHDASGAKPVLPGVEFHQEADVRRTQRGKK
jgi:hypothetical protein